MRYKLLILIYKIIATHGLTCNEILDLPTDKKLSFDDLKSIPPKEIVQCIPHLGKEQLGVNEADYIWRSIIGFYEAIPNIPEEVLMQLHWVTAAILPEEYSNITLSSIDVISNFGLNYNLNKDQLLALAERVREDFAGKEPDDYTYYDLTALRQILCAFNRSDIERIHPAAYREAALTIGKLDQCSANVLMGFATLAVQKSAFGSPDTWSETTVEILGVVADYLPKEFTRNKT